MLWRRENSSFGPCSHKKSIFCWHGKRQALKCRWLALRLILLEECFRTCCGGGEEGEGRERLRGKLSDLLDGGSGESLFTVAGHVFDAAGPLF